MSNNAVKKAPDVTSIMEDIRQRVVEGSKDNPPVFVPAQLRVNRPDTLPLGALSTSDDLAYLNHNYTYPGLADPAGIQTHRSGPLGKLIVKTKQKTLGKVIELLKNYFETEQDFNAGTVRYLNDVSRYIDDRHGELTAKSEAARDETSAGLRSLERRMIESQTALETELREKIHLLNDQVKAQQQQLETLESVSNGLEHIAANIQDIIKNGRETLAAEGSEKIDSIPDYSYLLLENRFRGSEEEIAQRLSIYPEIFKGAEKQVLEIGCGRGELLNMLGEKNIPAYGVDMDKAMVQTANEKGLKAKLGDGIAHLRSLDDNSIGGVIAIQVVEHLVQEQLEELLRLCASKVAKGGTVVFETINPRSLMALSSNYFRDPTHKWPMHPDTMAHAMKLSGIEISEVRPLSPVASESLLKPVEKEAYMTPRWELTVDKINRNFQQLNELLYGHQDYCIIGKVNV